MPQNWPCVNKTPDTQGDTANSGLSSNNDKMLAFHWKPDTTPRMKIDKNIPRCGHIALIGAPNAGKSTLMNRMVGQKISIVTPKAQTIECASPGVTMEGKAQLIFLDVPGVFDAKQSFEGNGECGVEQCALGGCDPVPA